MIEMAQFLAQVNAIADEGPRYRLGGYGRDGTCDCIGLTIGAIRRAGGEWKGTHGSNYAARYEIRSLRRVSAADMRVGMQLLKAREPGASGYALPARYANGADKRDYYHAGVCTRVNPLEITHSTGTGKASSIKRDTSQGKWLWGGELKQVNHGDTAVAPMVEATVSHVGVKSATVSTQNGGALKIRAKPTKACRIWNNIPNGATVDVLETDTGSDGWWKVRYNGRSGYCWSTFLAVG